MKDKLREKGYNRTSDNLISIYMKVNSLLVLIIDKNFFLFLKHVLNFMKSLTT